MNFLFQNLFLVSLSSERTFTLSEALSESSLRASMTLDLSVLMKTLKLSSSSRVEGTVGSSFPLLSSTHFCLEMSASLFGSMWRQNSFWTELWKKKRVSKQKTNSSCFECIRALDKSLCSCQEKRFSAKHHASLFIPKHKRKGFKKKGE